jgi:hypothetical protein
MWPAAFRAESLRQRTHQQLRESRGRGADVGRSELAARPIQRGFVPAPRRTVGRPGVSGPGTLSSSTAASLADTGSEPGGAVGCVTGGAGIAASATGRTVCDLTGSSGQLAACESADSIATSPRVFCAIANPTATKATRAQIAATLRRRTGALHSYTVMPNGKYCAVPIAIVSPIRCERMSINQSNRSANRSIARASASSSRQELRSKRDFDLSRRSHRLALAVYRQLGGDCYMPVTQIQEALDNTSHVTTT